MSGTLLLRHNKNISNGSLVHYYSAVLKGDCWDNAVAESFFHTLKVELIHGKTYNTRQEAKTAIFEYIEGFYNRQRRHSYLGYLSPEDFEKKNAA